MPSWRAADDNRALFRTQTDMNTSQISSDDSLARRFVVLHGNNSSLVLEYAACEAPLWRYWGPRLPDGISPGQWLRDTRPLPPSSLELEQPLTVLPTFGVGSFDD